MSIDLTEHPEPEHGYHYHNPLRCTAPNCPRKIDIAVCVTINPVTHCGIPAVWRCSLHERRLPATETS